MHTRPTLAHAARPHRDSHSSRHQGPTTWLQHDRSQAHTSLRLAHARAQSIHAHRSEHKRATYAGPRPVQSTLLRQASRSHADCIVLVCPGGHRLRASIQHAARIPIQREGRNLWFSPCAQPWTGRRLKKDLSEEARRRKRPLRHCPSACSAAPDRSRCQSWR